MEHNDPQMKSLDALLLLCCLSGLARQLVGSKILVSLTPKGHSHLLGLTKVSEEASLCGNELLVRQEPLCK